MKRPFVITIAATAMGPVLACGSNAGDEQSVATTVTDAGVDGSAESGSDAPIDVPVEPAPCESALWFAPCGGPDPGCMTLACASGSVTFQMTCSVGTWSVDGDQPCGQPYDHCPEAPKPLTCQGGHWTYSSWSNPPGPCPATPPTGYCAQVAPNDPGIGYDPPFCGYPCEVGGRMGWEVIACTDSGWISQGCN